jgi:hypothetical protein
LKAKGVSFLTPFAFKKDYQVWEKIDGLPDDDKLAVKKIVAALLVKHSVELAVR